MMETHRYHQISEGTPAGTVLKFSGKGMPSLYNPRKGDHYISLLLKIPR